MATEQEYERLRLMVNEDESSFPDTKLDLYLEEATYMRLDDEGEEEEHYDLHRAAAAIWLDKAGDVAAKAFNAQVDMTKADRRQIYTNMLKQARYHETRARAEFQTPLQIIWEIEEEDDEDNISAEA